MKRALVRRRQKQRQRRRELRTFHGKLTADAEHRFNAVYASGRVVESGCNAHGRRKFRDAEQTQPVLAAEGGAFLGAIYGEEEKAQKKRLAGDALLAHRRARIRPIADKFERWLAAVKPTLLPSEPLMIAVQYYERHRDALFRIPTYRSTTPPPSASSRTSPSSASTCFSQAAPRAPIARAFSSASSRRVARSASQYRAYLAWAFDRLGAHRDVFGLKLEDMTPAAFKKTLA